jgi:hypothetical protein
MQAHPHLAATYAQMGRDQDAQGERVVILHLSPFFDARTFAAQFGTQEARPYARRAEKGRISLKLAEVAQDRRKTAKISGNTTIN